MAWVTLLDEDALASVASPAISGAAGAAGASASVARQDHVHAFAPAQDLSMGGFKLANLGAPVGASDAARKADVDAAAAGISWKTSARAATTVDLVLSATQTIDGVAVVAGDRVLVKDQVAGAENGIYVVAAGAWARSADADSAEDVEAAAVFIEEGATNADSAWLLTTDNPTLDTTALVFTQFSGLGQVIAGDGLTKTGNQLDVGVDDSTVEISGDALRVKASGIQNTHLAADSVQATQIQAGAVGNSELGAGAVTDVKVSAGAAIALSKLATDPLARANHTGSQAHTTISDFDAGVQVNRLDQMADATSPYLMLVQVFSTAARPAPNAGGRFIVNSDLARLQIDR